MAVQSLTGVVDYGVGNVRSVCSAISAVGGTPILTSDRSELLACDRIILPGVGAFAHGMGELIGRDLDRLITEMVDDGIPLLGICLGMQMLAKSSQEFGETKGLGFIDTTVSMLRPAVDGVDFRLPHVGWKTLSLSSSAPEWLFDGLKDDAAFYFIHSFAVSRNSPCIAATSEYCGAEFASVVADGDVIGTQFHPEKSGPEGLKLLKNFVLRGS